MGKGSWVAAAVGYGKMAPRLPKDEGRSWRAWQMDERKPLSQEVAAISLTTERVCPGGNQRPASHLSATLAKQPVKIQF